MINFLYIIKEFILSELILKLHRLIQSLLITSLVSVPQAADRLDTEQAQAAVKGAVAKPNRAPIITDAEFVGAIKFFMDTQPADQKFVALEAISTALSTINNFLQLMHKECTESVCRNVLDGLSFIAYYFDERCTDYFETHIEQRRNLSSKETNEFYKDSGLMRIASYLQQLTNKLFKKINHLHPNVFKETNGIKFVVTKLGTARGKHGTLFILKDLGGLVPVFIPNQITHCLGDITYTPFYGNFSEGYLSRSFVYSNGKLMDRSGVFLQYHKIKGKPAYVVISLYSGFQKKDAPLLTRTLKMDVVSLNQYPMYQAFKSELPGLGKGEWQKNFKGKFIPMSDIDSIHRVAVLLLECGYTSSGQGHICDDRFVPILGLLAELLSHEWCLQEINAPFGRDDTVSAEAPPATGSAATVADEVEEAIDHTRQAELVVAEVPTATGAAAIVADEVDASEDEVDTDTLASEAAAVEAPLTQEQIHKSLYEQVMATVPEGRIKQRVLDRLIQEWLAMTKIPLDQLRLFVRGSHKSIHVANSGLTTVSRHGQNDRTYSPAEARRLANQVVDLAATK